MGAVTVTEAARRLGVSRTKVWAMVRDGELVAYPDPVDKRQRLIAEEALDALVDRRPTPSRLWPRGIGSISDPDLQSDEVEDWLSAHWQP